MRLLWINPNTTEALTQRMVETVRRAAAPETEIVATTATHGVPYISSHAEAAVGACIVLETIAEHQGSIDAAVIAAFADPGLAAAREQFSIPVVGLAEASMLTACMLGRRFSIVSFATAMGPIFRECVEYNGLSGRLASIRLAEGSFSSITDVQQEKEDTLVALANRAVTEDNADVVIFAGAPLTGLAMRVADRISVPVVDGPVAAVKQAEALVALNTRKAIGGSFRHRA